MDFYWELISLLKSHLKDNQVNGIKDFTSP